MEVVDVTSSLPCNAEVLQFLKENRSRLAGKSSKDKGQAKAATVVLETLNYLDKTPAGKLCNKLASSRFSDFIISLEKFKLTSSEQLQIINHCPQSQVEIQLLVQDSEERLSESEVEEILDLINVHLIDNDEEQQNEPAAKNQSADNEKESDTQ